MLSCWQAPQDLFTCYATKYYFASSAFRAMLQSVLRKQVLQGNYIVPIPIVTMCVAENRHSAPLHDSFVVS